MPYGYLWTDEKREYLGRTVSFKTRKHFKDKKSHYVDENEWTIFENTHEPIIDQDTFDNVHRIRSNVRCSTQHRINAEVVITLISDMLRAIAAYSKNDRTGFIKTVQDAQTTQQAPRQSICRP